MDKRKRNTDISSYSSENNTASESENDSRVDISEFVTGNTDDIYSDSSKKKSTKKIVYLGVRIASGVFALIFAVLGAVSFYFHNTLSSINYEPGPDNSENDNTQITVAITNDEGENVTVPPIEDDVVVNQALLTDDNVLNIMLFGTDSAGSLSDTMILLSIDNNNKKIKMTSFLRDTYVRIADIGYNHKLNYAYASGGVSRSIKTIEGNFGVRIDRYASVNFDSFKKIVDILGGVELYLTADEIGYINAQIQYNGQSEYLYASEGMVTLNGQQALWYARNRGGFGYAGDDWDRTDRQRNFLEAVINNIKDASLTELVQIVNAVAPNITTNLKKTEIEALLARALTYLDYDIEKCSMPSDGTWGYDSVDGVGSIIRINDWDTVRLDIAEFIYEDMVQVQQ